MAKPKSNKPRVIKNYEKLDEKMRKLLEETFPEGFQNQIETLDIGGGKFMSALRIETEDFIYLIKFPVKEDVDLDSDGIGGDDEMDLTGGEDVDEEEEPDEVEKPTDNFEDIDIADESGLE
ncbi:MAG: hypothetical protein MJZ15_09530 [Bacteroidales bacterium]|nr:hypothetical protein [Bacteroidales bacterium]